MDFISLLYEHSKYLKWFPFTKEVKCIAQPGKAKKLMYFQSQLPILDNRDFKVFGFGVNNVRRNKSILLLCRSVDDSNVFPKFQSTSTLFTRGVMHLFGYEMRKLKDGKLNIKGIINVDPKLPKIIPLALLNYGTKMAYR